MTLQWDNESLTETREHKAQTPLSSRIFHFFMVTTFSICANLMDACTKAKRIRFRLPAGNSTAKDIQMKIFDKKSKVIREMADLRKTWRSCKKS